jgi:hypothetical protein
MHERLDVDQVQIGSERSFGLVFAAVFALIGLWPLLRAAEARGWALALAALFLAAGLWLPQSLRTLNRLWFKFGLALARVTTPLVMGLLFFAVVAPTGLFMRLRGKDLLRLRIDRAAATYWIERAPPGPAPDSMRNQF